MDPTSARYDFIATAIGHAADVVCVLILAALAWSHVLTQQQLVMFLGPLIGIRVKLALDGRGKGARTPAKADDDQAGPAGPLARRSLSRILATSGAAVLLFAVFSWLVPHSADDGQTT